MLGLGTQLFRRAGAISSTFVRLWNTVSTNWNNSTKTWDD